MKIADPTTRHPMFSVVTCCFNQGLYIEDCIRSVLDQQYPNVEHIVIDSGNDCTHEICARYPHVRYVFQEPAGQSAALNAGFELAQGEIIAWLNADDYYLPGAFRTVTRAFRRLPPKRLVSGEAHVVNEARSLMWKLKNGPVPFFRLLAHPLLYRLKGRTSMPCQPSVFFPRQLLADAGTLRCDLKYSMDYEFWLRTLRCGYRFKHLREPLSCYRYHGTSLTASLGYDAFLPEWQRVSDSVFSALSPAGKALARMWNTYFYAESFLFRRHQRGVQRLQTLRSPERTTMPLTTQLGHVACAVAWAPWLLADMVWRTWRRFLHG